MNKRTVKSLHPKASQAQGERDLDKRTSEIFLGVDVHQEKIVVVRQEEGLTPQPAQRFSWEAFVAWAAKQKNRAEKVYACYEAGGFGFGLQRKLEALGITCYVIRPQNWDEHGAQQKTDGNDALAMCQRLERYVRGNRKALHLVRVPTEQEEQARVLSRQREQLVAERKRIESQGRSLLQLFGVKAPSDWWKPTNWKQLTPTLSLWLKESLEVYKTILTPLVEQIALLTKTLQEAAGERERPKGAGAMTWECLRREVGDWSRFKNRRQVASYTGLCPSQYSSGKKERMGSINKHGNPRLRWMLVEMAWRITRFQPDYWAWKKWHAKLTSTKAGAGRWKQAIVALARQLAIDLWRINTGQTTLEKLGLTPI